MRMLKRLFGLCVFLKIFTTPFVVWVKCFRLKNIVGELPPPRACNPHWLTSGRPTVVVVVVGYRHTPERHGAAGRSRHTRARPSVSSRPCSACTRGKIENPNGTVNELFSSQFRRPVILRSRPFQFNRENAPCVRIVYGFRPNDGVRPS